MNELAFVESSTLRQDYAHHVEVLNEVDPVALMNDGRHVSTEMVAAYFGVGVEAIKSLVKDNRCELETNEYNVISGDALRSFKDLCGIATRGRSYARFTKRTVLNVAMLLRDSEKARAIRTRLLDMAQGREVEQRPIPRDYPNALRAYADEVEAHQHTKEERDALLPLAEAYSDLMEADGTFDWAAVAQIFSRITGGLGRNNFLELLRGDDLKVLKENNTPYQVKHLDRYFKVIPHKGGSKADPTTRVTPEGLDWLRKRLVKHFNHQPGLFAIGEIA